MGQRKSLSKSVRFKVFKRDSFTCQYCGRAAPDTELHVDHVFPVSMGGGDDFENLVTSCPDCNFGKGAKHVVRSQSARLDVAAVEGLVWWLGNIELLPDELDKFRAAISEWGLVPVVLAIELAGRRYLTEEKSSEECANFIHYAPELCGEVISGGGNGQAVH